VHRHIAALEADVDIFEALLVPLIISRATSAVTLEDRITSLEDHEGEDIPVERIVKRSRLLSEYGPQILLLVLCFLLSFLLKLS
jgi:hypothetical protein